MKIITQVLTTLSLLLSAFAGAAADVTVQVPVPFGKLRVIGTGGAGQSQEWSFSNCATQTGSSASPFVSLNGCQPWKFAKLGATVVLSEGNYFVRYSGSTYPSLVHIANGTTTTLKLKKVRVTKVNGRISFSMFADLNDTTQQDLALMLAWGGHLSSQPHWETTANVCAQHEKHDPEGGYCEAFKKARDASTWAEFKENLISSKLVGFEADARLGLQEIDFRYSSDYRNRDEPILDLNASGCRVGGYYGTKVIKTYEREYKTCLDTPRYCYEYGATNDPDRDFTCCTVLNWVPTHSIECEVLRNKIVVKPYSGSRILITDPYDGDFLSVFPGTYGFEFVFEDGTKKQVYGVHVD